VYGVYGHKVWSMEYGVWGMGHGTWQPLPLSLPTHLTYLTYLTMTYDMKYDIWHDI
jgi:hypothetical protein